MRSIDTDALFVYNENGLRVKKTVNGVVTDYTLHGKNIVHMKRGDDELHFFYDAQNRPAVVVYNGTAYAYVKSLQGDIVALLNGAGNVVVSYVYDAWGAPIGKSGTFAETLGTLNPFRYRGYVFDEETVVYYLRSRYYSAERCRFVNADSSVGTLGTLGSHTAYAYCRNAVVNQADYTGRSGKGVTTDDTQTEYFLRTLINTICGFEHDSNYGNFSMVSRTENVHISKAIPHKERTAKMS